MENRYLLREETVIKMKNKFLVFLPVIFMFFVTSAYSATFTGKVIDVDTKEPIEGAVVVASWTEEKATVTGGTSGLKDVKETLTDKNGEWVLSGPIGREEGNITAIFSYLTGTYYTRPPVFIVFKPGYCSYPAGFGIESCKGKIKTSNPTIFEPIGEIVELPRLTNREDRIKAQRISPSLMDGDTEMLKKIKEFIRLKNEERKYLGLEEVDF